MKKLVSALLLLFLAAPLPLMAADLVETRKANFKQYLFKIRAKLEQNMDEMRVRCNIMNVTKLDYA